VRLQIEAVEPRVLYSADPVGGLLMPPPGPEPVSQALVRPALETSAPVSRAEVAAAAELVVVDAAVPDAQRLVDAIAAQRGGAVLQVVQLDPGRAALAQIGEALAGRERVAALHVVAHGEPGALRLSGERIDARALDEARGELHRWRAALTDDADLLLYGCDLASSDAGVALLARLARYTGADVAASDDRTGSADAGGDWTLEARTGAIEARALFDDAEPAGWSGTLAVAVTHGEQRVNTDPAGAQQVTAGSRSVAVSPDGSSLVVWETDTGTDWGIRAQRFLADGSPTGPEFAVNQTTAGNQTQPEVAAGADGSWIVVWQSDGTDGSGSGIYARRIGADGTFLGDEFRANQTVLDDQSDPSVGLDAAGNAVIAWQSLVGGSQLDVMVRRFDAAGNPLGDEITAAVSEVFSQYRAKVSVAADGRFVVVWESWESSAVLARLFAADGTPITGELGINTAPVGFGLAEPDVAMLHDGFVVAWSSWDQDGSGAGVYARRFGAGGAPLAAEFRVNEVTAHDQRDPQIVRTAGGGFVVAWSSNVQDGDQRGTYLRQYAADGTALTPETRINPTTVGSQGSPALAVNASGVLEAVWTSDHQGSADVYRQRYRLIEPGVIVVDTTRDVVDGDTSSHGALWLNPGADGRVSLREAILAANATPNGAAPDRILFAIPRNDPNYAGGVFTITVTTQLPNITDAVTLDATSQAWLLGDTNAGQIGTGGTVGAQGTPLLRVARPEIELVGGVGVGDGFVVDAPDVTLLGFAMRAFDWATIRLLGSAHDALIASNVLGSGATAFLDPGVAQRAVQHVSSSGGADRVRLTHNLIGWSQGIAIETSQPADGWSIDGNEVRGGSLGYASLDTLWVRSATALAVVGNLFADGFGSGIDLDTVDGLTFTDNSVVNIGYGFGGEGHSILAWNGVTGVIARNLIRDAPLTAIRVLGTSQLEISQNSIQGSGGLPLDLGVGVTPNDPRDTDSGPNDLANFPVLTQARASGGSLTIEGTLNTQPFSAARVEFFSSPGPNGSGYGEGAVYLGSVQVGTDASGDASVSTTLTGVSVTPGHVITATSTLLTGGPARTSEFASPVTVTAAPNAAPVLGDVTAGLSGHWRFNDGTGTSAADASGNGRVGTLVNMDPVSDWVAGRDGGALDFDGIDDMVQIANDPGLTPADAITVAAWIRPSTAMTNWDRVASSGNYWEGWHFTASEFGSNDLVVYINNGVRAQTASNLIQPGVWQHVAFTYDRTAGGTDEVRIYLNGALVATGDYSVPISPTASPMWIGASNAGGPFSGRMDDVHVYGRALPSAEIQLIAQAWTGVATLTPIAEDDLDSAGDTVAQIVPDGAITDVDHVPATSAPEAIAITAVDDANGRWQYRIGAGAWIDVDPVQLASRALLLDATDRVRFVPDADWNGSATFTFRAWDRSSGAAGEHVTIAATGGTSAFSTASGTASITVTATHDAPTVNAPASFAVTEDVAGNLTYAGVPFGDADSTNLTVTLSIADGTIAATSGGGVTVGGTATDRTFSGTVAALNGFFTTAGTITYTTAADNTSSRTLTTVVSDGSALASATSTVSVTAVNDAPSGTSTTIVLAEDGSRTFSAADFGFSDVDGHALQSVTITTLPQAGVLTLDGVRLTGAQTVAVGSLPGLVYTPNPGQSGVAYASLGFRVTDTGGTANGGVDTDPAPDTLTFDVTAANDAPLLGLRAANLVENGSFEGGTAGWSGNRGLFVDGHASLGLPAGDEAMVSRVEVLPGATPDYLQQTLTTVPGQRYAFSVLAVTLPGNAQDMGALSVDGVELGRFTTGADWARVAFAFTATGGSTTIRITSLGSQSGAGIAPGDALGLVVDDVRVEPIDGAVDWDQAGVPVAMAPGVSVGVFDADLGAGTYAGATLTLARNGGANAEDRFSATGTLGALTPGGPLTVGGATIGTVTANGGGTLVLGFGAGATQALVNDTISQIAYANTSGTPPASVRIDWTFGDGNAGAQGAGGALTATGSITVAITGVLVPPSVGVPGALVTPEDTWTPVTGVTVSDPDSGSVRVMLQAGRGVVDLDLPGGVTLIAGALRSGAVTVSGSPAQLTAALATLRYLGAPDTAGADTLTVTATDAGGLSDTGTVAIDVQPVNDAPVLLRNLGLSVPEAGFATIGASAIEFADVDDPPQSIRVQVVSAPTAGELVISQAGVLTVLGVGDTFTQADLNAGRIGYRHTLLGTFDDAVVLAPSNDGTVVAQYRLAITIDPVNDPPKLEVPAWLFTREERPVVLADGPSTSGARRLLVRDDASATAPLELQLAASDGATLTLGTTTELTFVQGDGTADAAMVFRGTLFALNRAIDGLRIEPARDMHGTVRVSVVVDDLGASGSGGPQSASAVLSLQVDPVNDPPVLTLPPIATVDEDATLAFGGEGGPRLRIDDLDTVTPMRLSLSVDAGTLSIGTVPGLVYLAGDGSEDSAITVEGTVAQLQAALDALRFQPPADWHGTVALDLLADDREGAVAQARLAIGVAPTDDLPVAVVPGPQATRGDTPLDFSAAQSRAIRVADPDGGNPQVEVTVSVSGGRLQVNLPSTVSVAADESSGGGMVLRLTGRIDAVNDALDTLQYQPGVTVRGSVQLEVSVRSDDGRGALVAGAPKSMPILVSPSPSAGGDPGSTPTNALPPLAISPLADESDASATSGAEDRSSVVAARPAGAMGPSSAILGTASRARAPTTTLLPDLIAPGDTPGDGTVRAIRPMTDATLERDERQPSRSAAGTQRADGVAWLLVQPDSVAIVLQSPLEQATGASVDLDAALAPEQAVRGEARSGDGAGPVLTLEQSARAAGLVLTAGAVWWAIYGGTTLWILLAAGPLARTFDPLPVLARDHDDTPAEDAADALFDDRDDGGADPGTPRTRRADVALAIPA
jgi:hypothetical protein